MAEESGKFKLWFYSVIFVTEIGKLSVSKVNNPAVEMLSYLTRLLLELIHENHWTVATSSH